MVLLSNNKQKMTKQIDNTILWVIGIVLFLIIFPQLDLKFPFAIVTTVTCVENITNYYSLDGNLIDLKGNQDITNNGAIFIDGKLGNGALEFNGTNFISFPTLTLNLSTGFWINNYSNTDGWTYIVYNNTNILSDSFMLGLNGSIDEIVVGTNIEGLSNIQPCYITSYEENISCKKYFESTLTDNLTGSLMVIGDFYPNCTFMWEEIQYEIITNQCSRNFFYQSPCLNISNCYVSNQSCIENLEYDCYVIINNICTHKTDYGNCTGTNYYTNLTVCQANLTTIISPLSITTPSTITPSIAPPEEPFLDKLKFEIFGYEITMFHLIILLGAVGAGLYFLKGSKKK